MKPSENEKPMTLVQQTQGRYYVLKMGTREIGGTSYSRLADYARKYGYTVRLETLREGKEEE